MVVEALEVVYTPLPYSPPKLHLNLQEKIVLQLFSLLLCRIHRAVDHQKYLMDVEQVLLVLLVKRPSVDVATTINHSIYISQPSSYAFH